MSCILRFSAPNCNIDAIISELSLEIDSVFRKGEPKQIRKWGLYETSGFQIVVSEAGFNEFKKQVSETTTFIENNISELLKLEKHAQALTGSLFLFDFGITTRMHDVAAQCDYFPATLVRLIGGLGAGIELSQYPPDDEEGPAEDEEAG